MVDFYDGSSSGERAALICSLVINELLRFASRKYVPCVSASRKLASRKFAPIKLVSSRCVWLKSAPLKSASIKLAPLRSAPCRLAPASIAPCKSTPTRLNQLKLAPCRLAPLSYAALRFALLRFTLRKSALLRSHSFRFGSTVGLACRHPFQLSAPCFKRLNCSVSIISTFLLSITVDTHPDPGFCACQTGLAHFPGG